MMTRMGSPFRVGKIPQNANGDPPKEAPAQRQSRQRDRSVSQDHGLIEALAGFTDEKFASS